MIDREERLKELRVRLADAKTELAIRQAEHDKRKKLITTKFKITSMVKIKAKVNELEKKIDQFQVKSDNLIIKAERMMEEYDSN